VSGQLHAQGGLTPSTKNPPIRIENEEIKEGKFYKLNGSHSEMAEDVQGRIQNIPDWCRHLYSSCGSAKHR
jgi:hypothetical protein